LVCAQQKSRISDQAATPTLTLVRKFRRVIFISIAPELFSIWNGAESSRIPASLLINTTAKIRKELEANLQLGGYHANDAEC
jgi:hypothetical protein